MPSEDAREDVAVDAAIVPALVLTPAAVEVVAVSECFAAPVFLLGPLLSVEAEPGPEDVGDESPRV